MKFKISVVINCSSNNQNIYFFPSYLNSNSGYKHDLIIIHRNFEYVKKDKIINTSNGNIIYENKILNDNNEIPHRATGSYKYIFSKYKDNYDFFLFLVDHTVIRRDNWILDAINIFNINEKIGFLGSQIFNGHKKYPHPSHVRGICIWIKKNALDENKWIFNSDHEGELLLADSILSNNFIGLQIGNKINYIYDSLGDPIPSGATKTAGNDKHITHIIENKFFPEKKLLEKFEVHEYNFIENTYFNNLEKINEYNIVSPHKHIGTQNIFIDIEPFDLLIYYPSLNLSKQIFKNKIKDIGNDIFILDIKL